MLSGRSLSEVCTIGVHQSESFGEARMIKATCNPYEEGLRASPLHKVLKELCREGEHLLVVGEVLEVTSHHHMLEEWVHPVHRDGVLVAIDHH